MHATRKYLAPAAITVALVLPYFGTFDRLLENFPPEARGVLLLIYIITFAMLIPLDPDRWMGLAFAVIASFFSLYPLLKGTVATDSFEGTDGHVYPISMMGLYAVGVFYLLLLRSLLIFRKSADGDSRPVPVETDRN